MPKAYSHESHLYNYSDSSIFSVLSIASSCYEGDFESSPKGHRLEIVLNREPVLIDKCLLPAQSAYSKVFFLA